MEESTQTNLNNIVSADPFVPQVNNSVQTNNVNIGEIVQPSPVETTITAESNVVIGGVKTTSLGITLNNDVQTTVASTSEVDDNQPLVQTTEVVTTEQTAEPTNNTDVVTEKVVEPDEERTFSDNKIEIKVTKLKNLIRQIRNVAICESVQPLSQIIYLRFDMNGFYVSGTNTYETVSILDVKTKYNGNLEISVDADLFAKLVSQLDEEELNVTLNYVAETRILEVVTKGGTFKFPEKIDPATGESIKIEPVSQNLGLEEITFSYSELTQALELGKGVRNMAIDAIRGLFLGKYTASSDQTTALIQPKIFNVGDNKVFFMRSQFVSLLETLAFSENGKYKYIKANGEDINGLYITDGAITITGPLQQTDLINNNFMETHLNMNNAKKFAVNRERLAKVMRRTNLFVNTLEDKDYTMYLINNTSLKVQTLQGGGSEFIALKTPVTFESNISVPSTKMLKLLESLKIDDLNMSINDENDLLCIDADSYKFVISLKD